MISWNYTKVEAEKIMFCPKCGCGDSFSSLALFCKQCLEEFKENEEIVCFESQKGMCTPAHFHRKCFEEFEKNKWEKFGKKLR